MSCWDASATAEPRGSHQSFPVSASGVAIPFPQETFNRAKQWLVELEKEFLPDEIVIALVGNKTDLADEREVAAEVSTHHVPIASIKTHLSRAFSSQVASLLLCQVVSPLLSGMQEPCLVCMGPQGYTVPWHRGNNTALLLLGWGRVCKEQKPALRGDVCKIQPPSKRHLYGRR